MRPTTGLVRGAIFSILGPGGVEGKRVLDLYAGTGALGLEALRRGAGFVDFVEVDRRRCEAISAAAEKAGLPERWRVHRGRVERLVARLEGAYQLVFIDPPYAEDPFERVIGDLLGKGKLAPGALVFAEHDRRRHISERHRGLGLMETRLYGDTAVSIYRKKAEQDA